MADKSTVNVLFIWTPRSDLKKYIVDNLSDQDNVNLIIPDKTDPETLMKLAPHAQVMVGWKPFPQLLEKARQLKLFINPGAGVQHLISLFQQVNLKRKVILTNCHGNAYFTAQHGVALLLALTNKIILHHKLMIQGKWRSGDQQGASIPLKYRKIGLLRFGAVNQKIHRFLSGYDNSWFVLKRKWDKQKYPFKTFTPSQLKLFLRSIDILFIAIPQTRYTINLISKPELELLGTDSLLVNISRGSIVNEADLYYSLKNNKIKGAAIDVWYDYKPEPDTEQRKYPYSFPFHQLPNIVLSPHRGASPFDNLERWNDVIENIRRFADRQSELLNIVDLDQGY
ncbi:MAG: hypothetical protein APR63_06370 [Desulfuromonas sp. SDB]|nr:MAG: hypothetical protein APR63_06370 [Desulfuromonas sp. SDB]